MTCNMYIGIFLVSLFLVMELVTGTGKQARTVEHTVHKARTNAQGKIAQ